MNSTGFKPSKYKCLLCDDVIYSRSEGEYTTCECGACAIDQTRYYTRLIGNIHEMELVKDE